MLSKSWIILPAKIENREAFFDDEERRGQDDYDRFAPFFLVLLLGLKPLIHL